jgi:hypothetical protein
MILEIMRRFFCRWRRRKIHARDLKRINAAADRLNPEAEEVLEYQTYVNS